MPHSSLDIRIAYPDASYQGESGHRSSRPQVTVLLQSLDGQWQGFTSENDGQYSAQVGQSCIPSASITYARGKTPPGGGSLIASRADQWNQCVITNGEKRRQNGTHRGGDAPHPRERSRSPPRRADPEDRRPRSPPPKRDDDRRPAGYDDRRGPYDVRRGPDPYLDRRRDERRRDDKDERFEERPPRANGDNGWGR